jgi:RND family efflux transporter MFP subunit
MTTVSAIRHNAGALHALLFGLSSALAATQAAEVDATLHWSKRVELSTPMSGVIVEIAADTGQRVAKDQVLLRLDTGARAAKVEQAKAQVARQTRLLDEAQREIDRSGELFVAQMMAEHEMEVVRIAYDEARAHFETAKAELAQAQSDLQYSEVRAPFDAVVVQRYAEVGQTVATQIQAVPLLAVAEADAMIAQAAVSASVARSLKPDQKATVRAGGKEFEGRVMRVGMEPLPRRDETRYAVDIHFNTRGTTLRTGESARVVLP